MGLHRWIINTLGYIIPKHFTRSLDRIHGLINRWSGRFLEIHKSCVSTTEGCRVCKMLRILRPLFGLVLLLLFLEGITRSLGGDEERGLGDLGFWWLLNPKEEVLGFRISGEDLPRKVLVAKEEGEGEGGCRCSHLTCRRLWILGGWGASSFVWRLWVGYLSNIFLVCCCRCFCLKESDTRLMVLMRREG